MIENFQLSIVLPLYKPKGNWVNQFLDNVGELNAQLPDDLSVTFIVVHDGPIDTSIKSAFHRISQSVENIVFTSYPANRGKGYALREGIKLAESSFVLITDFDFPYKTQNLIEIIRFLERGYDVVTGKRSKDYLQHMPFKRRVIFKTFVLLNRIFLDLPVHDTQSGIKGFNAKGKNMFLQTTIDRFLADTEFVLRSHKNNLAIKIIDVEVKPKTEFSNFGAKVIKTEVRNFLNLIRLNKKLNRSLVKHTDIPAFQIHEPS
jgi:glycosyltransferase involved in cell wall biosynthesis